MKMKSPLSKITSLTPDQIDSLTDEAAKALLTETISEYRGSLENTVSYVVAKITEKYNEGKRVDDDMIISINMITNSLCLTPEMTAGLLAVAQLELAKVRINQSAQCKEADK
jgi:hypothetical protein